MLRYLWIAGLVLILDQASKFAIVDYLGRHGDVSVLPFLNFALAHNRGAAFGFLHDSPGWQNIFFIAVAIFASTLIVVWLRGLKRGEYLLAIGLTLVLGGALGNLADRFMYSYVVDFIDVVFGSWHFWTFNVADSAITIGAIFIVGSELRSNVVTN